MLIKLCISLSLINQNLTKELQIICFKMFEFNYKIDKNNIILHTYLRCMVNFYRYNGYTLRASAIRVPMSV